MSRSRCVLFPLSCSLAEPYPYATGMTNRQSDTAKITDLLLAVSDGGRDAVDELVPVVYDQSEVGLVHEGSRLQRMAGRLAPQLRACDTSQMASTRRNRPSPTSGSSGVPA